MEMEKETLVLDYYATTLYPSEYEKTLKNGGYVKIPYLHAKGDSQPNFVHNGRKYKTQTMYILKAKTGATGELVIKHVPITNGDVPVYLVIPLKTQPSVYEETAVDKIINNVFQSSFEFDLGEMIGYNKTARVNNANTVYVLSPMVVKTVFDTDHGFGKGPDISNEWSYDDNKMKFREINLLFSGLEPVDNEDDDGEEDNGEDDDGEDDGEDNDLIEGFGKKKKKKRKARRKRKRLAAMAAASAPVAAASIPVSTPAEVPQSEDVYYDCSPIIENGTGLKPSIEVMPITSQLAENMGTMNVLTATIHFFIFLIMVIIAAFSTPFLYKFFFVDYIKALNIDDGKPSNASLKMLDYVGTFVLFMFSIFISIGGIRVGDKIQTSIGAMISIFLMISVTIITYYKQLDPNKYSFGKYDVDIWESNLLNKIIEKMINEKRWGTILGTSVVSFVIGLFTYIFGKGKFDKDNEKNDESKRGLFFSYFAIFGVIFSIYIFTRIP